MKKIQALPGSCVTSCYIVPGLPHVLLAPDKSPGWRSLFDSYARARAEIENTEADLILYFSTQWLSVLGYLFQADPEPSWTLVDHNWHELGAIRYQFAVDTDFASVYAREVKAMGHYTREVNYKGFPIDTGCVVAQKLLNPDNRFKAAMVSCNMYAEKQEALSIGQAAIRSLQKSGKKAIVVLVSSLSSRFETKDIDPAADRVSSLKDDEWNRKILDLLGEGRLEDVSEVGREYARQANADMGFRGVWWLNGLCGKSNAFTGRVFDYQPVWGTGAALVGLYPTAPVKPVPGWVSDEADLVERLGATKGTRAGPASAAGARVESLADAAGAALARGERALAGKGSSVHDIVTFEDESREAGAVRSRRAPPPVGPYPHARRHGDLLFLSGVGPRQAGSRDIPGTVVDADGNVVAHDIAVQTRAVIENVKAILEDAGASLNDVVDVQVFLTDLKRDFPAFNKVYAEYFAAVGATRTTIEVTSLPTPIAVELKVIAKAPMP